LAIHNALHPRNPSQRSFDSSTYSVESPISLAKWHPIAIDFSGPFSQETNQQVNPFLDYRLDVSFTAPNGESTLVPGFFAGDGQGNGSGNVWRVRFSADQVGQWSYRAVLRTGTDVAVAGDENAGSVVNPMIMASLISDRHLIMRLYFYAMDDWNT